MEGYVQEGSRGVIYIATALCCCHLCSGQLSRALPRGAPGIPEYPSPSRSHPAKQLCGCGLAAHGPAVHSVWESDPEYTDADHNGTWVHTLCVQEDPL